MQHKFNGISTCLNLVRDSETAKRTCTIFQIQKHKTIQQGLGINSTFCFGTSAAKNMMLTVFQVFFFLYNWFYTQDSKNYFIKVYIIIKLKQGYIY